LEKCDISDTRTCSLQDDLNDFLALVPTDRVLEIAVDYLSNDREVQEFVVYIQSEEFLKILRTVEDLREFKDMSVFMFTFFKSHSDRENVCSVSMGR
jgi:hypothetical protein